LLQLSFRTVILASKKEITEVPKQKIKLLEKEADKLYETIMNSEELNKDDVIALATSYCNMGLIFKNDNSQENLSISENYLHKSLQLLKGDELDCRAVLIVMRAYVQIYDILYKQDNPEYQQYLYKIIDLYLRYTTEDVLDVPCVIYSIKLDIEGTESNYIISLYTLYSKSLNNSKLIFYDFCEQDNFIITMHKVLESQWSIVAKAPLKLGLYWAEATTELAQYLYSHCRFIEARNSLAAAEYTLNVLCQKELSTLSKDHACLKFYMHMFHTISVFNITAWGVYGLSLIQSSTNSLLYPQTSKKKRSEICKVDESKLISSIMSTKKPAKLLLFMNLEENLKNIINKVTDTCVSNVHDARLIFNHAIQCFNVINMNRKIEETYDELSFIEQYFPSALYKYLIFFEIDRNEQLQLYKKQIQILEQLYNADYFIASDISALVSRELVIAYANLIDMLLVNADMADEKSERTTEEIFELLYNSVICYRFISLSMYEKLEY